MPSKKPKNNVGHMYRCKKNYLSLLIKPGILQFLGIVSFFLWFEVSRYCLVLYFILSIMTAHQSGVLFDVSIGNCFS